MDGSTTYTWYNLWSEIILLYHIIYVYFGSVFLVGMMHRNNFLLPFMIHNIMVHHCFLLPPILAIRLLSVLFMIVSRDISKYIKFDQGYQFRKECLSAAADW
jgi:hypothetical protein